MAKLRVTNNTQEIIDIFNEAIAKKISVTLWQKDDQYNRQITQGTIVEMNEDRLSINFDSQIEADSFSPELSSGLYFHTSFFNVLFKQDIISSDNKNITIKVPPSIRVRELRSHPRKYYNFSDRKEINYRKQGTHNLNDAPVMSILANLSEGGASFYIAKDKIKEFKINENISIASLHEFEHTPEDLTAEIKHISFNQKATMKMPELHTVGIQFNYILANEYIKIENIETVVTTGTINDIGELPRKKEKKEKQKKKKYNTIFIGLEKEEQERIINLIITQDQTTATLLIKNIAYIESLHSLTKRQQKILFEYVDAKVLGVSFRLCSMEFVKDFLFTCPSYLKKEIIEHMQTIRHFSIVSKAQVMLIKELNSLGLKKQD